MTWGLRNLLIKDQSLRNCPRKPLRILEYDGRSYAVNEQPYTGIILPTVQPHLLDFWERIITVYTNSYMLTCVADLRIKYWSLTGRLDNVEQD